MWNIRQIMNKQIVKERNVLQVVVLESWGCPMCWTQGLIQLSISA